MTKFNTTPHVRAALLPILASFLLVASISHSNAPAAESQALLGTWRLISIDSAGQPEPARGAHPTGLIYYDATAHMAVQIMAEQPRPRFAGPQPTAQEALSAYTGYTAYFGRYTVDERAHTVTHHREGSINPALVGVDAVRRYEFLPGGRLLLTPVDQPMIHLTWERLR